jgi:hypothetical protein
VRQPQRGTLLQPTSRQASHNTVATRGVGNKQYTCACYAGSSSTRTAYSLPIHCLFTTQIHARNTCAYLLPIHCKITAKSLQIHCLFTAYSLPIHCLFTTLRHTCSHNVCVFNAYALPIHCLFTAYALPIHCLGTVYCLLYYSIHMLTKRVRIHCLSTAYYSLSVHGLH